VASKVLPTPTFLQSLLEPERVALLRTGRTQRWQPAEMLVRRGARADSAIVILAGLAKIHTGVGGAEVLLGLSGPGDLLGEVTAVRESVRSATATALEPVEGVVIPVASLHGFLADHPRATLALLDLALTRLYVADARRMEFATSESLARVAGRLVELAERFGVQRSDSALEVALPITQEELASWSASSRESTARALRTLRGLGLIETNRRRLTVLDLDGLRGHTAQL
jgi:CRP-like cAMP-binding protein